MNSKKVIKAIYSKVFARYQSWQYVKLYNQIVSETPDYKLVITVGGEQEWLKRWEPLLGHSINPLGYRIFSHMAGESVDRLPLEVCVNVVEPTLNPRNYIAFYDDKNSLPRLMRSEWLPKTFLRSINGHLFSEEGCIVADGSRIIDSIDKEKIIVKPSCEQSGRGVQIFKRDNNGHYYNKYQEQLSIEFLRQQWKDNWLIQECINQSEELSKFNPSSINTIRIATYRSLDGTIHPIGHVLRVGGQGSEVDNAHAGGMFCGIDSEGHLGSYFCDALARTKKVFNGIDLSSSKFEINNFGKIREFACTVAAKVQHHDLVALDIAITEDGTPKLLEININGFSAWLFEMTSLNTFGDSTEEVIQRCKSKLNIKQ